MTINEFGTILLYVLAFFGAISLLGKGLRLYVKLTVAYHTYKVLKIGDQVEQLRYSSRLAEKALTRINFLLSLPWKYIPILGKRIIANLTIRRRIVVETQEASKVIIEVLERQAKLDAANSAASPAPDPSFTFAPTSKVH